MSAARSLTAALLFALGAAAAHAQSGQAIVEGRNLAVQICGSCHDVAAPTPFATTLQPPPPSFRSIANRRGVTDANLRDFIIHTHWDRRSPPIRMPNHLLTSDQADDVAAYIMSLKDAPRP